jgi:PKD repeat protein
VTGTLTVTDNEGKTASKNIPTVSVVANIAPVARVTPSTQTVNVNGTANFNATTSSDADGTVVAYDWNWGDGSNLERTTSATPTHSYASGGSKTVRLTVWDNGTLAACPLALDDGRPAAVHGVSGVDRGDGHGGRQSLRTE